MIPAIMALAHFVAFWAILSAITGLQFGEGPDREPGFLGYLSHAAHHLVVAACAIAVIWLCAHLMGDSGGEIE